MTTDELSKYDQLLKLSRGHYKAYLYDCDGTLADNMPAHRETYVKVAADKGLVINGDIIDELAGWPIPQVIMEINKRYGSNFDPDEFTALKTKLFYEEYIQKVKPIAFVANHLAAHVGKVKIGVVSGSSRKAVETTLNVIGVHHLVEAVVCAGETPRGKPFPDPFLACAEKLGISPEDCLVFEDGDAGVQAAIAAGMGWIRIDKL